MKYKLKKRSIIRLFATVTTITLLLACGFEWGWYGSSVDTIVYESHSAKAGEDATFTLNFRIGTYQDYSDKLVIAVQVPKAWNPRELGNIDIEYRNASDDSEWMPMEIIPVGTLPRKAGVAWELALLNRFGAQDPNVLDDMQWVAFISKGSITQNNKEKNYQAKVKIKTGTDNTRAKIGFCLYHEEEGGGDKSGDYVHYAVVWSDCFDVTDGEGDIIDFCDLHFNQHTPGMSTQNDIVTLRYIGDIATNDLMVEATKDDAEIYINAVAVTTAGRRIEINEKSEKTKLIKESSWGLTFSKTLWPEAYFNLAANETLAKIEYYFVNKNGDKYVSLYDDQHKNELEGDQTVTDKPLIPFEFAFK